MTYSFVFILFSCVHVSFFFCLLCVSYVFNIFLVVILLIYLLFCFLWLLYFIPFFFFLYFLPLPPHVLLQFSRHPTHFWIKWRGEETEWEYFCLFSMIILRFLFIYLFFVLFSYEFLTCFFYEVLFKNHCFKYFSLIFSIFLIGRKWIKPLQDH